MPGVISTFWDKARANRLLQTVCYLGNSSPHHECKLLLRGSGKLNLLALTRVSVRFEEILSLCITSVSFLSQLTNDICDLNLRISSKPGHSVLTQLWGQHLQTCQRRAIHLDGNSCLASPTDCFTSRSLHHGSDIARTSGLGFMIFFSKLHST